MKNAIVTGASNGIGLEISKKLTENNYYVGMIDIDKENLIKESKKIHNSIPIEGDVTNEESIKNALKTFNKTPDLIVNNAGIVIFGNLEEQSIKDFKKVLSKWLACKIQSSSFGSPKIDTLVSSPADVHNSME